MTSGSRMLSIVMDGLAHGVRGETEVRGKMEAEGCVVEGSGQWEAALLASKP